MLMITSATFNNQRLAMFLTCLNGNRANQILKSRTMN